MPEEAEGTIHAEDLVQEDSPVEETSPAIPTALEDVAKEVIAGRWGRGLDRKARLEAAGYDVHEVNTAIAKIYNQR